MPRLEFGWTCALLSPEGGVCVRWCKVDQATPAREMRSSEGRVLETADAFLDDRADRLWRTRAAALRELAQKVRDGTAQPHRTSHSCVLKGQCWRHGAAATCVARIRRMLF